MTNISCSTSSSSLGLPVVAPPLLSCDCSFGYHRPNDDVPHLSAATVVLDALLHSETDSTTSTNGTSRLWSCMYKLQLAWAACCCGSRHALLPNPDDFQLGDTVSFSRRISILYTRSGFMLHLNVLTIAARAEQSCSDWQLVLHCRPKESTRQGIIDSC